MKENIEINNLDFYSFFTKYSLMDEYGFSYGLLSRIFRKVLPVIPERHTIEYYLDNNNKWQGESGIDIEAVTKGNINISKQLDLAIKALCSKVIAFGLDNNLKAKFVHLDLEDSILEKFLDQIGATSDFNVDEIDLIYSLEQIELLIIRLRQYKNKIGTNFHLTLSTRRILEYIERTKELLELRKNINSKSHWNKLFNDYREYSKTKNSLRKYVNRHTDLVALEIVEHTSNKGQKYIAENWAEYKSFFVRSLLGGGLIALFAFVKIMIESYKLSSVSNAFYFSINYAFCFIIVKQFNGIIATKQPSMTASTIARHIDKQDDLIIDSHMSITILIRKVFRSQFISLVGNFLMAFFVASLIIIVFDYFKLELLDIIKPQYLIKSVLPSYQLLMYAMIAGFFLALAGLISGYIDNKLIFSKIPYRIVHSNVFWRSQKLADYIDRKAGSLAGNIVLGALLGSGFLFSSILPFQIDIRHIAFSAANVGYALFDFDLKTILMAFAGVALIGMTNFIVSFSLTLYLALKSRGAKPTIVPKIIKRVIIDFINNPSLYFFKIDDKFSNVKT